MEYLRCEVRADQTAARTAVQRAVEALGKHAAIAGESDGQMLVYILPGMVTAMSSRSPQVHVTFAPAGDRVSVSTAIGRYATRQSKFLAFIPAGPKTLVGRSHHRRFLDTLEAELIALDPNARPVRGNGRSEASTGS
jgi:hypothetical protein